MKLKAFGKNELVGLYIGSTLKLIKPQCSKNECNLIIAHTSPDKCLLHVVAVKYLLGFSLYKLIMKFL